MRWRLYIYYYIVVSPERRSLPLQFCPPRVLRASTAAVDLSGGEGRARQPCCARARGCVYVGTHARVGRGGVDDAEIVFARESLLRFEKPFLFCFKRI